MMDKKIFSKINLFIKHNYPFLICTIIMMLGITFGEHALSSVLLEVGLEFADYILAVIRMILQSALSTVLVYKWYRDAGKAAPFAAVDILKLFISSFVTTVALTFCVVLIVLLPLAIFLYLRWDFFVNRYITGQNNGVFSCIGSSFRASKPYTKKYFLFNLKYLSIFFLIELAITIYSLSEATAIPGSVSMALNIFDIVFLSLFMPYRFLLKCGFYDAYFTEVNHGKVSVSKT